MVALVFPSCSLRNAPVRQQRDPIRCGHGAWPQRTRPRVSWSATCSASVSEPPERPSSRSASHSEWPGGRRKRGYDLVGWTFALQVDDSRQRNAVVGRAGAERSLSGTSNPCHPLTGYWQDLRRKRRFQALPSGFAIHNSARRSATSVTRSVVRRAPRGAARQGARAARRAHC